MHRALTEREGWSSAHGLGRYFLLAWSGQDSKGSLWPGGYPCEQWRSGFPWFRSRTSIDVDQRVMNINFFGGVALVKALLPDWLDRQTGHVVQVSSVQGFFGLPGRTAYAAAKHAAVGFYDSLRAEVAENGVSVTTVCPGYIATAIVRMPCEARASKYPEGHTSKGVRPSFWHRRFLQLSPAEN